MGTNSASQPSKHKTRRSTKSKKTLEASSSALDQDGDLIAAAKSLSMASKSSNKRSKKTPPSVANSKVDSAYIEGAHPGLKFDAVTNAKDQVPAANFTAPTRSMGGFSSTKSYTIFIAPESPEDLSKLCLAPIGEGTTFCLNKNCQVNHRGSGDRMIILPGEVFILADRSRAFKEPSSNSLLWESDLYDQCTNESVPASEWIKRSNLVKNHVDLDPHKAINSSTIVDEELFTQKVKNFQSVRKRKQPAPSELKEINYSLGPDFDIKPESGYYIESISNAIVTLDRVLKNLIQNVQTPHSDSRDFQNYANPSLFQSDQAFNTLSSKVGTKPSLFHPQFDAPTLWSSLGLLSSEMINITNQFNFNRNKWFSEAQASAIQSAKSQYQIQFKTFIIELIS